MLHSHHTGRNISVPTDSKLWNLKQFLQIGSCSHITDQIKSLKKNLSICSIYTTIKTLYIFLIWAAVTPAAFWLADNPENSAHNEQAQLQICLLKIAIVCGQSSRISAE